MSVRPARASGRVLPGAQAHKPPAQAPYGAAPDDRPEPADRAGDPFAVGEPWDGDDGWWRYRLETDDYYVPGSHEMS